MYAKIALFTVWVVWGACELLPAEDWVPQQDSLPVRPPGNAVVLFRGEINQFVNMHGEPANWTVENGELISTPDGCRTNHLLSRRHFRDAEAHVEFLLPPDGDGNSGIYLQGLYEVQIFNSLGKNSLAPCDMGGIYWYYPPRANATRPPGAWQVLDIRYRAPRWDEDQELQQVGRLTAWLNGKLVQDEAELGEPRSKYNPYRHGATPYTQKVSESWRETNRGPLVLQDHDSPVRFRNIWVMSLDIEDGRVTRQK